MTEVQLIIRFPERLADIVNKALAKSKESIDIKLNPEDNNNKIHMTEPNRANIKFGDHTYPALIARLPCNIETHKTFDHIHYFKAGDIAEMVQVFETEDDREFAHYEMCQTEGYRRTYLSGITPPTTQIIRRRFMKSRSEKPKSRDVVSEVEAEIQQYVSTNEIVEEFEEVVDFEEYMANADNPDGCVFNFDSAALTEDHMEFQCHPEMLLRSSDKGMMAMLEEKEKQREARSTAVVNIVGSHVAGSKEASRGGEEEDEEEDEGEEEEVINEAVNNGSAGESGGDSDSDSDDDDFLNDVMSGIESK